MPERGALRNRLGIAAHTIVLLFCGRLNRIKRPDIGVDVLAAIQSAGIDGHLILAGPDEDGLAAGLRHRALQRGCANQVHLTGLLTGAELRQAFADADLLIMPSESQENFGMSALEAMAAGLPILVSTMVPVGRWAEQAGAGRTAPCSAEAFSQTVLELLRHPQDLEIMARRGQKLAQERFDSVVIAEQMLAQYRAIIATGRPLPELEFAADL